MRILRLVLLIAHGFAVLSRFAAGASLERHVSETPEQTAAVGLSWSPRGGHGAGDTGAVELQQQDDEYYDDDDELSGDYGVGLPRVAFSTKPKDLSMVLSPERKGKGRKGKKGKGRKRDPCERKYKDFCIHGVCRYLKDLRTPSCICMAGYSGERCHLFTLPVVTEKGGYNRTTALAVMAVVLSTICFIIIGILLALRCHKQGEYNVETEEKVKLDTDVRG
ncbi:proheparin-binding EGF-like growth factor isoform X1 [Scleropages formosus]|uniref:proheparin-binding EGF-like growth factor isoform X1 n=1 Tax=Scleropages formosus TaxID=113540 RepID=UPI00087904C5|nr:proheparin-binding EGF-like growth factor isoform X1 [Scleropages formosus]